MTKLSAPLLRNMYNNVVLLCCGVPGYVTLSYDRRVEAVGWTVSGNSRWKKGCRMPVTIYQTTRCRSQVDKNMHIHLCKNPKSNEVTWPRGNIWHQVGHAICRPVRVITRHWFNTSTEMSSWARLFNSDKFKSLLFIISRLLKPRLTASECSIRLRCFIRVRRN